METIEYIKVEGEQIWLGCYFCQARIGFVETNFISPLMDLRCGLCKTPMFVLPEMSYD